MNKKLKKEILLLYKKLKNEDSLKEDRLDRWRNLEPESAEFISIIIRTQQTKRMLEIGTSNGFSTLWFADALKSTNGELISLEIEKNRTEEARKYLTSFNLISHVELLTIDAKEFLDHVKSYFDIIFLDAERKNYVNYWSSLKELLNTKGSLLIVDNIISHEKEVEEFIALIENEEQFVLSKLNIGAGILLVTKI